ncbi:ABC transporter substrate-binding protein [Halomicrococcus sp. SG-WS-1]|uniref:ABC transporter substrate-binding protein n=1 Tax=Halomicrococcus sp. SG-WS-1 TaxID=3439057 RepID=UPI003F7995D4
MVNDGTSHDGQRSPETVGEANDTAERKTNLDRRRFLRTAGVGVAGAGLAGRVGAAANQGSITIGVLAPEPGQNPIGASMANSARLAAEEINENGGIGGATVDVSVKDTQEDPSVGNRKYQELTVGEQVDLTTGVFTSEVLLNIMSSIAQQRTLHLSTGAATPEASRQVAENYEQFKYFFRTGPVNSQFLGRNMVDFAEANFDSMGWDSVAVLAEDFKWTEPISQELEGALGETGVDVPINTRYASDTENFSPIYDRIQSAGVDAAYVVMAHTGTAALVQWAKQQRPFGFGGIHVPMQLPSYYQSVNGAARFAVTQNSATPTSEITQKTVPYANAYQEAYGQFPVYTGYITYDAVKQYAAAVQSAGSRDPDDVIPALEESSYTGTTGTLEYYGRDQQFPHDVKYGPEFAWPVWLQWQETDGGGRQEVIWPEDVKTTDYESPPWV